MAKIVNIASRIHQKQTNFWHLNAVAVNNGNVLTQSAKLILQKISLFSIFLCYRQQKNSLGNNAVVWVLVTTSLQFHLCIYYSDATKEDNNDKTEHCKIIKTIHLAQAAVSEQQPHVLPNVFQWNWEQFTPTWSYLRGETDAQTKSCELSFYSHQLQNLFCSPLIFAFLFVCCGYLSFTRKNIKYIVG